MTKEELKYFGTEKNAKNSCFSAIEGCIPADKIHLVDSLPDDMDYDLLALISDIVDEAYGKGFKEGKEEGYYEGFSSGYNF